MADKNPFSDPNFGVEGKPKDDKSPNPFSDQDFGKDPSLMERAGYGAKRAINATRTALTSSPEIVGEILADQNAGAPRQSVAARRMQEEIKPYNDATNAAEGVFDTVKAGGAQLLKRAGQFISEPVETLKSVAEQIPNSLPGMAGGLAGMKAGAALGTAVAPGLGTAAGAVIGGALGGTAGAYLTEKGSSIQEQVQKKAAEYGVNQTDAAGLAGVYKGNQSEIDSAAALKGVGTAGTDAVLNVLTMGLSGIGRRALSNEIAQTYKAVKAGGMSAADGAKQLATLEARHAAQNTLGQKAIRGAGVVGAEMAGEAVSEGVGQKLAYGSVDAGEVIDEGLLGFGQGALMGAASGTVNKIAGTPTVDGIETGLGALRKAIGPAGTTPADPLLIGNTPDPYLSFADGTVARKSEMDAYIGGLPNDQQPAARAKIMGLAPQPADTTDQASQEAAASLDASRDQAIESGGLVPDLPAKPSEAMGLAPTAGPSLANAAILSVDTGIHQAATEEADPYNTPLSALGQELSRTNQRLRQEADALGLDTEGLHGDAARMTDGKPHEDYLMAANDQLRKAMKAAKEIPDEGQRSGSDDPAPGGETKGPDAQAGKAPAGNAAGPVGAGAVRPSVDRVGEHGQRAAGTDGGNLPGAVGKAGNTGKVPGIDRELTGKVPGIPATSRDQAIAKASDAAGKVLASGGTEADANRAATDSLIDQMASTPGIAIAQDAPAAVKAAKAKPPANNNAQTTTSAPAAPAAGLPAAGAAPVQAAGVSANRRLSDGIKDLGRIIVPGFYSEGYPWQTGYKQESGSSIAQDGKDIISSVETYGSEGTKLRDAIRHAELNGDSVPDEAYQRLESIKTAKGTTANVPQPAQPGTQASQTPSTQGAAPAGGDTSKPTGTVAPSAKVRSYNVVAINEKTGEKTTLTKDSVSHQEAVTIKSKFNDKPGRRIQLEEVTATAPSIDDAAHQAATSPNNALAQPTDGQKKAGNYAKGHVILNGLDLSIENPAGSERSGTDKGGKAWKNTLKHHYGYIKGTVGNDKDHVDLFVKPETPLDYSGTVFVIDQQHPHNGKFDEHKVMVGFANQADAKKAYFANYAKGWKGMSAITPMTFDAFKAWVKDGAKNTPVSKDPAASTQPQGATREPQAQETVTPKPGSEAPAAAADTVGKPAWSGAPIENLQQLAKQKRSSAREMRKNAGIAQERGDSIQSAKWMDQAKEADKTERLIQEEISQRSSQQAAPQRPQEPAAAAEPVAAGEALQSAMGAAGWSAEVAGSGNTIWTKRAKKDRYTAILTPESNSMEITVLVDTVDTQIASFKVADPKDAAIAANKAVSDDVADSVPAVANPKIKEALDKKNGLGAQLASLNAELERQGAVQNANTRAQRDAIRKQIAEQDFPEILKAVDGNIDTAEELNRAFKYAGDEPKAKTIERILKKRGITPEYQKRWSERLMEGQQAGTKPESVVKVPEAISTAIEDQLRKQKQRVMRRRNEESAPGLNLEQKVAAQTKTKAAEATLRAMRTSIFDAEDAAVKAIETGKASEFEKHADLFPAANDAIRAMLGQNDELDAEMQANESGLTAQTRADDVKKLVDAARKQEKEPAPGTRINGPTERAAADRLSKLVDVMPSTMTPVSHGARSLVKGVIEQLRKDKTVSGIVPMLETASQRFMSDGHAPFSDVIDEVIDALNGGEKPAPAVAPTKPVSAPSAPKQPSAAELRAQADLNNALADLGDIFSKPFKSFITPEQEQKLVPVLTRVLDAAFRLGYAKFKDAAKFALDKITAALGADVANALTLDHLQGAYIAMAGGKQGTDTKRAVIDVETKAEIEAHEVVDPDAREAAEESAPADAAAKSLTDALYQAIRAGGMPKDNPALKKLVEAFDGQPADQARMKQAQEELETAIAMSARDIVAKGESDKATFDALLRLYESQPNLNIRTSTSVANQAYSTPAPLAFLASRLAGITRNTVTHEPTGGTGMLLIGADPKKALVNELNDLRISALKAQGFAPTQLDAATMRLVPEGTRPDAVVTNPPFGSVKDAEGKPVKVKVDGFSIGQIDHLIAARALETMKDDGKATLILGANKVAGGLSTDDRIFFNWLYSHYNVAGHFEVDGDLYARQGAGWPVRVITINGRQKSGKLAPVAGTIQRADNWSQVYEQFTQSLDAAAKPATGEVGGGPAVAIAAPGASGGRRPQGSTGSAGNVSGARPRVVPDRAKPVAEPVGQIPDEQRLNAQSFVPQPQPGQNPAGAERPAKPAGTAAVADAPAAAGNEFQAPYTPRSARKDEGVLIPANMAQPIQDALSKLEDEVGDIDEFARSELGYATVADLHHALMGLQVDSVAMSIHQIKKGKAVVIADQTGIGKGRQAASIIRWAARQGFTPVFVSVKPSLFTDMYGDLADIGTHDVQPFIMNGDAWVAGEDGTKLFANKPAGHKNTIQRIADTGQLPEGRNAVFMTYSQINVDNVQRKALMALASNAVFVLDESHNAAGASATGDFVIGALDAAKGVTYLSATYAKRPDNMPLYFKTDIGDAAADADGLAVAMSSGGLPLQTVVSNNLVKAGQMFRRERSYDGVSILSKYDTPHRALHERMSDEATKALRAIVSADSQFHEGYVKMLKEELAALGSTVQDSAGNQLEAGVQHTEFSSVVHNFVKQMLLGLKAQAAADDAIESLRRGEKPIIAVENTMGSFLTEYAAAHNVGQGDSLGSFDYRTVLTRALARSRVIIEVGPTGDKVKRPVPLSELDAGTRAAYDEAQKVIDGLTLDIPVSPIDWMRAEITRAGYQVAEITGRSLSVDYSDPKKPVLAAIDLLEQKDKVNTTRQFNAGKLDALILNVAGSTGISLHASEKFEDQRQRHMIVAQAAGDINIFMQMLGRVHRTGQVRLPKYTILSVDLPTEKRPTAVLSIKMKSLNANTSSNTESATSVKSADILNKYGDQIVNQYLQDNAKLARELGLWGEVGQEVQEDIARKATGRLALQPIEVQHAFYDEVESQYAALIDYLNKTNQNDLEPRTFDFDAKETRQEVLFDGPNKDTPFGEDAIYGEYSIKAQGTPMTPAEIQAAMAESLGDKTPAKHIDEMLEQMDDQYKQFVGKLAEASRAAAALAAGEYDSTKHDAIGDTLSLNKIIEAAGVTRQIGIEFLRSHAIGKTFRIDINSEPFNAVVTNIRSTHKATGNPYSMSKIQVTVAVNGALRSVSVPATQFHKIEVSSIAPTFRVETLFKEQPPNQRETAKIVTGNLLAAYGELQGVRGTIISFTKQDGTSEQGILLPKLFDFTKNTRGDYRLESGAAALAFLQKSQDKDIGRFGIMSRDGLLRVLPSGQGVRVQVPKSKLKGAKYFLDKGLIASAGDFVSSGGFMVATVYEPAGAVKVLDLLMKKQALYALPSMAEEAKALVGKTGGVAFSRTQSDVVFSRGTPFYSELSRQIEAANINAAPGFGWKATIKGLMAKGVKADEITWSGIEEWLDLQTGKVTKAAVLEYLAGNGVQVEEVTLGAPDYSEVEAWWNDEGGANEEAPFGELSEREKADAAERYVDEVGRYAEGDRQTPKYAKYQLPGGENYREVLLTLPNKSGTPMREALEAKYGLYGRSLWLAATQEERAIVDKEASGMKVAGQNGYVSSHWDQQNVLAHIRVNDRTDADGGRVLFVEEIQSDFGQEGKKRGFSNAKLNMEKPVVVFNAKTGENMARFKSGAEAEAYIQQQDPSMAVLDYEDTTGRGGVEEGKVPLAPFVDKTDKWLTLALKRVVKMAVDGGYDRVAFVNGQQSAERFSLDKHLSELRYEPAGEGLYEISGIDHNLVEVISEDNITIDRVEELVGKEMAEKIANGEGEKGTEGGYRDWRSFSGDGLKIEAKGMRAFYDQIVPSATKALLKKLGGGQMEDVRFREDRGFEDSYQRSKGMVIPPITQTGFTITPAMQEKASGGLPLFRRQLAKFSRGAQKQANNAVQSTVDKLTADWQNKPEIVIAFDMQDEAIPDNVRLEDAKQRSGGAFGNPEGFYYRGVVYLLSSQLATDADIARVLAHESLGHYGLRGLYGKALKPILQQIATMRRADVIAVARQRGLVKVDGNNRPIVDVKTATNAQVWAAMTDSHKSQSAEEVLAEMAQTTPQAGFVKRAVAAIRQWLREHGVNLKLTDNDIIVNYILPARGWVERGPGGGGPKGGVSFARGAKSGDAENTRYTRQWYDRLVSLLPDSYRNDPYRREPLPAEGRDVQQAREVQDKIDALNKQIRGPRDTKGHGPVTRDELGNLTVDAREATYSEIIGEIKDLADEIGYGVTVTGVQRRLIEKFRQAGFESEISLAAIADRITGARAEISDEKSVYAVQALGTIMSYKPRGFPMVLFSRADQTMTTDTTPGVLFTDENDNAIVYEREGFRISVNRPGAASYVVLWAKQEVNGKTYWRKAGTLDTNQKTKKVGGVVGEYLGVSSIEIEKAYRAQGLGLEMYRALMANAAPNIAGVISYTPNRVNKQQVPSIYRKLGAFTDGDNQIIPIGRNEPTAPDSGGAAFSRAATDQTQTEAFKRWFAGSRVVDAEGKPLVVYHGTIVRPDSARVKGMGDIKVFDRMFTTQFRRPSIDTVGSWFSTNPGDGGAGMYSGKSEGSAIYPVYLSIKNPQVTTFQLMTSRARKLHNGKDDGRMIGAEEVAAYRKWLEAMGKDGIKIESSGNDGSTEFDQQDAWIALEPSQIKSATGNNGDFDPGSNEIMFSRAATARDLTQKATEAVRVFTNTPGKVNWWHKTVGTQYNLAQRSPQFKRVYDAVQDFIGDVSFYATEAADLAPKILPKLETWRDIAKSPVSGEDTKAIAAPIFEGTLIWARDEAGRPVKVKQLEDEAALMSSDRKAQRLLRNDKISEGVLKMWRGLPMEQYEALIDGKYEKEMLKGGLVWSDAELKSQFNLNDGQIALYREFRASTDKSLTNLAISDMLYFGGKDVAPIKEAVLDAKTVDEAAEMLRDYLLGLADLDPENSESLIATANKMIDKGDRVNDLMARGYAPLSRFGTYTLDVVDADGERVYFGLFESRFEADRMAKQMAAEYPGSTVDQGTLSEESYKLFAGVSPETVALFGDMLGLEDNGAYQDYLKLAKSTRSAMKRLIERKGIAGFSEDAGRVLAGFVYSNARQTSQNLHTGEMVQAANDIPKGMGELKDKATQLVEYIKHPQEEAQKVRGLLFAQYIGGSIASAMVNMTQPLTMTLPWLTQFGGLSKASKQMAAAVKDATRKTTGDKALDAALKRGEEDGTVSPQEVHDLMRQAQGKGALKSGDGTKLGNAAATAQNVVSRIGFGWGKLFSSAEQFNRRATFIAAYRTAVEQGMKNPDAFARRAIHETQGVYNKGNKPDWARGAVGSTLFTFKQYSIAYVEMLHRMATTGEPGSPERAAGRRGALYALAVLMLLSGLGGMPGADDLDDIISGLMQSLGYNFDSKAKRKAFLAEYLGDGAAQFMERGVSGLAGVPIDISGRMGLGNLIPATGLLTKKADHTSDVAELLGPAGDMAKRAFQAGGKLIDGDVLGNHGAIATAAPKAVQNLFQAADMADKGMYRDQTGRKIMETDAGDALSKALGFQPNDVKRAQDANWQVQQMKDLNRIKESEIASRWAIGLFEKNPEKIQSARDDLATWNADNPDAQIRINFAQIRKRVQDMNMTKAERIAKTTPAELRARVRNELALQ